jgi:ribonuclease HI
MKTVKRRLKSALVRAGRTLGQAGIAGIGVIVARWTVTDLTVSSLVKTAKETADLASGMAILTALNSLGWNLHRPVSPESVQE